MIHVHQQIDLTADDVVEVTLDGRANVMLLDPTNYERYLRGESFRYHGGLAERSPALLTPPHPGSWNVVVDLGGYPGHVRAGIQVRQGSGVEN
jgi:Domain of unknown function (DUF1883)